MRSKALRNSKESFPRGRGSFLMQKSNKITFFLVKNLHNSTKVVPLQSQNGTKNVPYCSKKVLK